MKEYDVMITETLQRKVTVEAESQLEAEQMVTDAWDHQDYVLGAEDFTGVSFDTVDEREREVQAEKIDVLLIRPNAYPEKVSIGTELEDLQKTVGGYIEVTYPFSEDVGLVMNEEGKLNGLPLNRALRSEDGDVYDVIAGDFLVVGLTEESFSSLSEEQMEKFEAMFHQPETFIRMGRGIMAIPIPDEAVEQPADEMKIDEVKTVPFNWEFGEETVSLNVAEYSYGNGLYIGITNYGEDGPEPFGDMTVNLPGYSLEANEAFISGDMSRDLLNFIKENKLGEELPFEGKSGYASYKAVAFDLDKLKAFDPKGVSKFMKDHGIAEKTEPAKKKNQDMEL